MQTLKIGFVAGVISSCQSVPGDFCDVAEPYRPDVGEIYTDAHERQLLAQNLYGERHCGWKQ